MEDTAERIRELEEANAALLDGHAKLSVAYLALRVGRLEDENRRLSKEVLKLKQSLDGARSSYAQLKRGLERAAEAHQQHLAKAELEWAERLDRLEAKLNTDKGAD